MAITKKVLAQQAVALARKLKRAADKHDRLAAEHEGARLDALQHAQEAAALVIAADEVVETMEAPTLQLRDQFPEVRVPESIPVPVATKRSPFQWFRDTFK